MQNVYLTDPKLTNFRIANSQLGWMLFPLVLGAYGALTPLPSICTYPHANDRQRSRRMKR